MNAGLIPDVLTTIEHLESDDSTSLLTRFEHDAYVTQSQMPNADYTNTLRFLRKEALSIRTYREEINFAKLFNSRLQDLSSLQGLHSDHFFNRYRRCSTSDQPTRWRTSDISDVF